MQLHERVLLLVAGPQVLAVGERGLREVRRNGRFRVSGRIAAENGDEGFVRQGQSAGLAAEGRELEPGALVIVRRIKHHRADLKSNIGQEFRK